MTDRRGVALLSGGLDSATAAAVARSEGYELFTLAFDYGQRHRIELDRAAELSASIGAAAHKVVRVELAAFGGSALTADIDVPKGEGEVPPGIPVTYVPARNTVFLSLGLAYAETLGTGDLYIGVNALDYSGYPDCRPAYIEAFEKMATLATKGGVEGTYKVTIHTPLIELSKREIIELGTRLGVDYRRSWSCYDPQPGERPCGRCDSCRLRAKGFNEAGLVDPALEE